MTARVAFGLALTLGVPTACSVDQTGLESPVASAGAGGDTGIATGGAGMLGSGGLTGSGGLLGSGGVTDSGGKPASGGAVASGGMQGSGGMRGTGGSGTGGAAACNPSTCPTGCCGANGNCVTTNQNDQRCGTAGAACMPCGTCFQCGAGACQPRPAARWTMTAGSATVAATKVGNMTWDPMMPPGMGPQPDPFCQLTVNGVSAARTTSILNTVSPVWNQPLVPTNMDLTSDFLMAQPARWTLGVFDDDGTQTLFETMCTVTPHLTAADLTAGMVTFPPTQSCTSLSIQLTCAE